jgi:capsular polysaccharide export protein
MIGVLSKGIVAIPHLESLLCESWTRVSWWHTPDRRIDKVAGWGLRGAAIRARKWASARGLPYIALEDGFLRSVGLGHQDSPLSIVADDLGVYFDSRCPTRLEHLINTAKSAAQLGRAERLITAWRDARVSKYNNAREAEATEANLSVPYALVIDQTRGDPSINAGMAGVRDFEQMLEAALDEQPRAPVVVKLHPDVLARRKRGHLERLTRGQASRVTVLRTDAHPASLIERARMIYVVTSQIGLEGLLWGKPVRTFGVPFYAGWGLTLDERVCPRRRQRVHLANLVYATLVEYMRCVDPETGRSCPVERLIAHLSLQRRMRERFSSELCALSVSPWKKPLVRSFFAGSDVRFIRNPKDAPPGATLIAWGNKHSEESARRSVIRTEDGFLRSVGLGAELVRPLSWSMDRTGIHYDATRPSDLEHLLATTAFSSSLLRRANALRDQIVGNRVTKYNLDAPHPGGNSDWNRPNHRRVILVPGQVEDDASLLYGPPHIRTNIELLKVVRISAPDAYIIYKQHPDVAAGLRLPDSTNVGESGLCDEVVGNIPVDQLFDAVHEVHVIGSLTGFEALIRGLRVVTHGCPFYAGWGLTVDHAVMQRRDRVLTLAELIAGALILYPTYISRKSGQFTTVERVVSELIEWRHIDCTPKPRRGRPVRAMWQQARRPLLRAAAVLRRAHRLTVR